MFSVFRRFNQISTNFLLHAVIIMLKLTVKNSYRNEVLHEINQLKDQRTFVDCKLVFQGGVVPQWQSVHLRSQDQGQNLLWSGQEQGDRQTVLCPGSSRWQGCLVQSSSVPASSSWWWRGSRRIRGQWRWRFQDWTVWTHWNLPLSILHWPENR